MEDIKTLLKNRFRSVLSEKSFSLFTTVIDYTENFEKSEHDIICFFPDEEETLTIYGPLDDAALPKLKEKVPSYYYSFLLACGGMVYGEPGDTSQLALTPGFTGTLHCLGKDLLDDYTDYIFSPIDIGLSTIYFIDTHTKQLCLLDEGIKKVVTITNDPIEVYLREIHYKLCNHIVENPFQLAPHRSTWLMK